MRPKIQIPTEGQITTSSGLTYVDVIEGTGKTPEIGDRVHAHYTGQLTNGKQFDSSIGRNPFAFQLGQGEVIKGWDIGIKSMKEGGKRILIVPPELGYGEKGYGPLPPNATLVFEVELVKIE